MLFFVLSEFVLKPQIRPFVTNHDILEVNFIHLCFFAETVSKKVRPALWATGT